MDSKKVWNIIAVLEIIIAAVVIIKDLFIPTLVVLAMIVLSLILRRETITVLGFKKPKSWLGLIAISIVFVVFLQLFDVGVMMPILNRLTGTTIDYSGFTQLKGNLSQLAFYLALTWTLAAFGEEIVYRGYLQKLMDGLFGTQLFGIILTIVLSSVIFGLAHLEQGLIGVIVCTGDAIFFSIFKRKFNNNLWASIFAHGFYNSLGMIIFYFVGPINGLW